MPSVTRHSASDVMSASVAERPVVLPPARQERGRRSPGFICIQSITTPSSGSLAKLAAMRRASSREKVGCCAPAGVVFAIDVSQSLPVGVPDDEARDG
jgi:hypothetical protein